MNAETETKKHYAQRIDVRFIERMERVAKRMRSSPRAVLELCLQAALPNLEKQFGLTEENS